MTVLAQQFLLPPEAYFSTAWWEREQAELFERTWTFVGPVADVPPDGLPMVAPVGRTAVLVRSGSRLSAERLDGGPALVDTWHGFVFVHAEPAVAPPLLEWLGALPDLIGAFQPERLVEVARARFDVAANWKLYVENHIDMYHLWYLHEQSLAAYDHPKHRWDDCAPHWSFYEPPRAGVADDAEFVRGFPPIGHIGTDDWGSGAHLVFPNLPFATGAGFFMTYQCLPVGPERTLIDLRVRAEPGAGHDVDAFLAMVGVVLHGEDGAACEQVQRALRSPAFRVGPLVGTLEEPITRFHEHYLAAVGAVTVPSLFVGAWGRRSIALGDGPPSEPASVVWVQGRSAYADLRVPFEPAEGTECFAGHTRWEPPELRWSHDIDLAGGPAAVTDVGSVEWCGDDLVERGVFTIDGCEVPYVEVWHRLPGSDGPVVEEVGPGFTRVVVGDHELVIADRRSEGGAFAAEYRRNGLVVLSHGDLEEVA